MELLIGTALVVAIAVMVQFGLRARRSEQEELKQYVYRRKRFIMTKEENEFFHALQSAIGTSYVIVPQAHLDVFLDHRTEGQNWKGALSKIQRKSVDFLICKRDYYTPLVAIELDDASHARPTRVKRDEFVTEICRAADMPLVRFQVSAQYEPNRLLSVLAPYLQ